MKIRGRATDAADTEKKNEDEENDRGGPVLEGGAQADAAVVDGSEEQSEDYAGKRRGRKTGLRRLNKAGMN
jgi:hypothetical protein